MKIGIDVQTTLGNKTGFGFYVSNLVKNLRKESPMHQYFLFAPQTEKDFSAPRRFWWDQVVLPRQSFKNKVNILHQPAFSAPVFYPGKVVCTVHDLIAVFYGKDIPFWSQQYFGRWMPFTYRFADHIIAVSKHTKKDLKNFLKIPDEKITVIPLAVDEIFEREAKLSDVLEIKKKYQITHPYLLHVGTISPRKNLEFLVRVFAAVAAKKPDLQLVITGKKGWYFENLFQLIEDLGLKDKVIFTGYIPDQDKPALYRGAILFVFPSLYEGVGLPLLEAMRSSCPLISSDVSSMPEVVGKAGILLSPHNEEGWVKNILEALNRSFIRQTLIREGLKQVKLFSWEKTAQKTVEVYEKILHNHP